MHIIASLLLLLLVTFNANAFATNSDEIVTLTFAYENLEQPPFYMGNSEHIPKNKPGVSVDIVKLLPQYIPNLVVKLKRMPWTRCKVNLKNGAVDGIFNASFKASRLAIGNYPWQNDSPDTTRRITTIAYSFYKLKESQFNWDGEKTYYLNKGVGAPRGYSIVSDLKQLGIGVDESNSSESVFNKLINGWVDAAAVQGVSGDALLRAHPDKFGRIVRIDPPIKTKSYYLMLSHQFVNKHPVLAEKIWNTIRLIRQTRFDELSAKYFP